jgi:serine/threonine-protein kinase
MLAPDTILQNRYRVVRELGHGGMGTVYEALDQRVNCIVALKETAPGQGEDARRAFEREASLLGNLRHSSLPKVMDYFAEKAGDFLVMEFIPGHDLATLIESREGPFPQSQVLDWADELLRVLEYLHEQDPPILHRDIKPSNLKLTKEGEIFLLDFGLAKGSTGQMPSLMTSRSVRGYTPVYASLEQMHGYGTEARSDLYSLGATLYHLLTGVAPIDAPARFHAIEEDKPDPLPAIERLNSMASPKVTAIIHQALAINRKQRPLSAAEMRRDLLDAAAEDESFSSEDEYRRAEVRRKRREQSQEAEPRHTAATGEGLGADEEAKRKAANLPSTIVGPPDTQPAPRRASQPAASAEVTTSPVPARLNTNPDGAVVVAGLTPTTSARSKRVFVIAAGILMVLVSGPVLFLALRARDSSTATQPVAHPKAPDNKPTPNMPAPPGMVYVPGGAFMMGRETGGDDAERPPHQVTVKPFFIDTYEVTNEGYAKFVKATGHRPPATWSNGSFSPDAAHRPVTGVTWDDANDYARWAGKRLPTEEEWEFAARGTDGRMYPWGNDWQAMANANGANQSMADVGEYKGTSQFGAYDMVGNAWEWTATNFLAYPGRGLPSNLPSGDLKAIRGGCFQSSKDYATTTYRTGWPARGAPSYAETGFRCAKNVAP